MRHRLYFYIMQSKWLCKVLHNLHNHPSGNIQPSVSDLLMTKRLKEVGDLLELPVLDHVIITEESYYSFADDGKI